jgi:hypothetical protein
VEAEVDQDSEAPKILLPFSHESGETGIFNSYELEIAPTLAK